MFSVGLVLITGCVSNQPEFNVTKTAIQNIDGKNFNIPVGAKASKHIEGDRAIAFYIKSGVDSCSSGDVTWVVNSSEELINDAIRTGNDTIHAKLAKEGKIGCASPLN